MTLPFHALQPLSESAFREVRLRTIFDCCKWDPQVQDISVLAPYGIVLSRQAWEEISSSAEKLDREALAAERELLSRPDLLRELALPRPVWKLLATGSPVPSAARVMRFDFHFTEQGWRISEVNSDVPGGFIEAEGFSQLMAECYSGFSLAGLPASALASVLSARLTLERATIAPIALVHASAYSDDRQVVTFLAGLIEKFGGHPVIIDPAQIQWRGERAEIHTEWFQGTASVIYRFFPGEWLPNLRRTAAWPNYFVGAATPQTNPGWAIISQSKRFGISLRKLSTPLPFWNRLLPETRDPREIGKPTEEWVLKPALGRVGEAIGTPDLTPCREWRSIKRNVFFFPNQWAAQRRFDVIPVPTCEGPRYCCFGVYTVNGVASGVYARASASPIINHLARDTAVFLEPNTPARVPRS